MFKLNYRSELNKKRYEVRVKIVFYFMTLLVGCFLLMMNLYGLSRDIRTEDFRDEYLIFPNDQPTDFNHTMVNLIRR